MNRFLLKLISITGILLLFTGCDAMYGTHHAAKFCKNKDYKGMLISEHSFSVYCSNGDKSQRSCWVTLDGEKCDDKVEHFYFLTFGD